MLQRIETRNPGLMMMGKMIKRRGYAVPPGPRISPDYQGERAYDLLNAEQRAMLKYALNEHKGKDVMWLFDQYGALHIKERKTICL